MSDIASMRERHILAYRSSRKHVDDLLARAADLTGDGPEHAEPPAHLDELTKEHGRIGDRLDRLEQRHFEDWEEEQIEHHGLMGIWDALAGQAEKLVEKLEADSSKKDR